MVEAKTRHLDAFKRPRFATITEAISPLCQDSLAEQSLTTNPRAGCDEEREACGVLTRY